jgi:hypothetical protein
MGGIQFDGSSMPTISGHTFGEILCLVLSEVFDENVDHIKQGLVIKNLKLQDLCCCIEKNANTNKYSCHL